MSAMRRLAAPETVYAGLLMLLVILVALPALIEVPGVAAYLAFVIATVVVVRMAPAAAGGWLGRRAVRRAVVLVLCAVCLTWLFAPGEALTLAALPLLILVVIGNVVLGRATERIASAPASLLDEREEQLRNTAHSTAYAALAAAFGCLLIAGVVNLSVGAWLLRGGAVLVLFELALVLPAMVIAWRSPAAIQPDAPLRPARLATAAAVMTAVAVIVPLLVSTWIVVGPVRTTASQQPVGGPQGSTCREYQAAETVGFAVQATLPLHAAVCSDGSHAFELWGLNRSDCSWTSYSFADVRTVRCTTRSAADGSLRFTYEAAIRPSLLPLLERRVTVELLVDRSGRVLRFP